MPPEDEALPEVLGGAGVKCGGGGSAHHVRDNLPVKEHHEGICRHDPDISLKNAIQNNHYALKKVVWAVEGPLEVVEAIDILGGCQDAYVPSDEEEDVNCIVGVLYKSKGPGIRGVVQEALVYVVLAVV